MTLTISVHRGTRQIGGSCIEITAADGERLILDIGRPLDASRDAEGLLPETLDLSRPAQVLISHPHMDHWGLVHLLPAHWPVWTGELSARLMAITCGLFGDPIRPLKTWHSRSGPFAVGSFTLIPFLTDHSAADAYMLLIERDGQRLLYTGDFRTHGRKSTLVDALMCNPPPDIDVLLIEGTNLRSDKPVVTEHDLEERFRLISLETSGQVFVDWSAQNLDRTVTLYRAAKRTGRKLVVDLYSADVLFAAGEGTNLPRPDPEDFDSLEVIITPGLARHYRKQGRAGFIDQILATGRATSRQRVTASRTIIMARRSLLFDYARGNQLPITTRDSFIHSNWSGYLDATDPHSGWMRAGAAGARREMVHTSGHASAGEIERFASSLAPRHVVPVHGVCWDDPGIALPGLVRLDDGEGWTIPT